MLNSRVITISAITARSGDYSPRTTSSNVVARPFIPIDSLESTWNGPLVSQHDDDRYSQDRLAVLARQRHTSTHAHQSKR